MFRSLTRLQLGVDIAAAAGFALLAGVLTALPWNSVVTGSPLFDDRLSLLVGFVLTAVFGFALALRRLSPGFALGIAWAAAIVQMLVGLPPLPANLAIFGILYTVAAYGGRLLFWAGFASAIAGAAVITLYLIVPPLVRGYWTLQDALDAYAVAGTTLFLAAGLALLLAWTVGALVRTGIRARENRFAQERAEAGAAAEQERTRIARDMHDVVAHSLAVVIAQADGARYASTADPGAATAALGTISTTARAALSDVRMLLTQLRHSQAEGPQPTLADLEQLYAQVRAAGVDLRVDVDPAPRGEAPAAVQLAVYRILQEALTNALRHGRSPVDVGLAWHPGRVELSVRNPLAEGPAAAEPRGHGLIGMRERAQLVGGALEAGADGDGFVVRATLPWEAVA